MFKEGVVKITSEDKVVYDERKQRFVWLDNLPMYMHKDVCYSHFNHQRPDLFMQEQLDFNEKLLMGQRLLRFMMVATRMELTRLGRQMGHLSFNYFYPLMDDYMRQRAVDAPRMNRLWTWKDSSIIVHFYE